MRQQSDRLTSGIRLLEEADAVQSGRLTSGILLLQGADARQYDSLTRWRRLLEEADAAQSDRLTSGIRLLEEADATQSERLTSGILLLQGADARQYDSLTRWRRLLEEADSRQSDRLTSGIRLLEEADAAHDDSLSVLRRDWINLNNQAVLRSGDQIIDGEKSFTTPIVGDITGEAAEAEALTRGDKTIYGNITIENHTFVEKDISLSEVFYFGSSSVDGSWRIRRVGDTLSFEYRTGGVWRDVMVIDPSSP